MKKFIIDHIDPFGQGVYKVDDQVYFIPKTLPKEKGVMKILKRKKGVHFCQLVQLEKNSPERITPKCLHYDKCNGCHFLHTEYNTELKFKKASYTRLLSNVKLDGNKEVEVIDSPSRFYYRNRVQLHYDIKRKKLGFKASMSNEILEVPNCIIFQKEIKEAYDLLYETWIDEVKEKAMPTKGHVELYYFNGKVNINWNGRYAKDGFTQVNSQTNQKLLDEISKEYAGKFQSVLDLFGGKGNMSEHLKAPRMLSVDLYDDQKRNNRFFHLDLFDENALSEFCNENSDKYEALIVDPPRSGFKELSSWVEKFEPKELIYVSCHASTMVRDLNNLKQAYRIKKVFLIDLFPGTYHYEAMIFLEKAS